ncbi:MAG: RnfABCDGE type electron transport complex subunit B [Nitrosomonas sp.]|nr:RnfABCDGE type electron transport complex subunit B [Nitrosomonas sp.]MDP1951150.1 RnfABCDGE type electron transport complex subunit B [Nitrosomonas sp.]
MKNRLIENIDAILPQTQCTQCGFPDCKSYAIAIAEGHADINQCPPGDEEGIYRLANLLGIKPKPLNTTFGVPKPKAVALIDENLCIGCTFCIQACPVDAIVGAAKQMHTVITAECTGCELCIAPCPMDCIRMIPAKIECSQSSSRADEIKTNAANLARARHQFRLQRFEQEKQEQAARHAQKTKVKKSFQLTSASHDPKKAAIQAALKRAATAKAQAAEKRNRLTP